MRRLADLRRSIVLSVLYPLLVVIVAWVFFAFFTAWVAPRLLETFRAMELPGSGAFVPLVLCQSLIFG
jgi:type II secretory pathway component PulF